MFGDWKLNEFQQWQEMWRPEPSILGVDLISSLEAINHSFIHSQGASPTRFIEVGESPHENYSYNTGRFMSEASFISLLRI